MVTTCTPKEWDTCRVEKMGCPGCYYCKKWKEIKNEPRESNRTWKRT